jgi:hypothetical protein
MYLAFEHRLGDLGLGRVNEGEEAEESPFIFFCEELVLASLELCLCVCVCVCECECVCVKE